MPRKQRAVNTLSPILGLAEVAQLLGWDVRKASVYLQRRHLPEPFTVIACGPLWRQEDIQAFLAEVKTNHGRIPSIKFRLRQGMLDDVKPDLGLRRRHIRTGVNRSVKQRCRVKHTTGPTAGRVVRVEIGKEYLIEPPYSQKLKHRGRTCTVLDWVFDDSGYVVAAVVRFHDNLRWGHVDIYDLVSPTDEPPAGQ